MKICSPSLVVREMHIQTQWGTTTHPLKWHKLERLTVLNVDEDMEQLELLYVAGENANCKTVWYLIKLNVNLPYNSTNQFLGFCQREMNTFYT